MGEADALRRENEDLRRRITALEDRDQTEERAARRSLQESERRYRTLAESLPHLVWTCRGDGPCDYLSRRWVDYTGIPEADQLGYGWLEQLHPDDRERVVAEWSEGAPRGGVFDIEFRIRRADGVHRWFKTRAIPFRDDDGRVVKWFGSNTDVDDYKRAEHRLRQSEEQYRTLFDNAEVGMYRSRLDGSGIVALNQRMADIFGFTKEEMLGPATMRWADPAAREEMVRLLGERGELRDHEIDIVTKGGEIRTVIASVKLYPVDGFLEGSAIDITERKLAEAALRESEERNRTTLRSIGDGVISTDATGQVTQMNPVAQALSGWEEAEAFGKPLACVFRIVNEDTRAEVESPVDRVLREGVVVGLANHTVLIAKDGTDCPIADSGAPIRNAKGEITGVVLVFRDQTEERAAQRTLVESERKFRDTVRCLDEGYYSCAVDGRLEEHNIAFNRILGFDGDQDLKGSTLPDFWQNAEDRKAYLAELMAKGVVKNFLINAKTIGGDELVVMANAHLVKDENGDAVRIEGTFTDFTDRRRMEERIGHLNLVLQAIRNVNQLIVREKDADTLIRRSCEILTEGRGYFGAWIALYDESGKYLTGASAGVGDAFDALTDCIKNGQLGACDKALRERGVHVVRNPSVACPGCPVATLYEGQSAMAVRLEHEGRVRGLLVMSMDAGLVDLAEEQNLIEEVADDIAYALHGLNVEKQRSAAEADLRKHRDELERRVADRTAELQLSKELVDETSKLAKVGGWEIDLAKNELSWTDVVREIHEVEPGFRPTVETGINFYAPEAMPVISEAVRRVIEEGKSFDLELQLITAKNNRIWVRAIGEAIRENGRIAKVRGVFQEINQRKLAEIELAKHREYLRDRTAQLEDTNKELEAFSYSVSHDLRAPLRAIDGFTRILADDHEADLSTEGKRVCSVIRENTGRMSRLIDDLLAFSRLGRTEMQLSPIDMGAMANAVFYELTPPASRERIDFQIGSLPAAFGDPSLMRQVWMNLLGNAVKFSSKRERAVITVGAEKKDGELIYAVRDNGAGFDMQYAHKLFGVFQRLHGMREFEGTGVGLALVQRIVRRHGGRVWAEGETDRGAAFHFALTEKGP